MGYLFTHSDQRAAIAWAVNDLNFEHDDQRVRVLGWRKGTDFDKLRPGNGKAIYVVIERERAGLDPALSVECVVMLLDKSVGLWGTKSMHEGEYPYYFDCPEWVLRQLSPLHNDLPFHCRNARAWRDRCSGGDGAWFSRYGGANGGRARKADERQRRFHERAGEQEATRLLPNGPGVPVEGGEGIERPWEWEETGLEK